MKTVILTEEQSVRPFAMEMIVGEQLPFTVLLKYPPDSADWIASDGLTIVSTSIIGREVSCLVRANEPAMNTYSVDSYAELVCKTYTTAHSDPHHAESYQRKFIVNIKVNSDVNP
jgi:hypothetical protein